MGSLILSFKKMFRNLKIRTGLILIFSGIVFVALSIIYTKPIMEDKFIKVLGEQTINNAQTLGDELKRYHIEDIESLHKNKELNDKYEEICTVLKDVKDKGKYLYVYTVFKGGDSFVYGFDGEYEKGANSDNYSAIGSLAVESGDEDSAFALTLKEVYESKKPSYTKELTEDEYGKYITAFAPIFDNNGNIVFVVGIDISNESVQDSVNTLLDFNIILYISIIALTLIVALITIYSIVHRYGRVGDKIKKLQEGDLREEKLLYKTTEIEKFDKTYEESKGKMREIINSFKSSSRRNKENIGVISKGVHNFEENFREISNDISTISLNTEEIAKDMKDVSEFSIELSTQFGMIDDSYVKLNSDALNVKKINEKATVDIEILNKTIEKTQEDIEINIIKKIEEIARDMKNILPIMYSINDITKRVNMLSLNASIEAKSAGESGRGFTVVADEIRKLAQKTDETAKEIIKSIQNVNKEVLIAEENSREIQSSLLNEKNKTYETIRAVEEITSTTRELINNISLTNSQLQEVVKAKEKLDVSIESIVAKVEDTESETKKINNLININKNAISVISNSVDNIQESIEILESDIQKFKTE